MTVTLVEKTARRIIARKADARDERALQAVVEQGVRELGRLDVVVADARRGHRDEPGIEIEVRHGAVVLD